MSVFNGRVPLTIMSKSDPIRTIFSFSTERYTPCKLGSDGFGFTALDTEEKRIFRSFEEMLNFIYQSLSYILN